VGLAAAGAVIGQSLGDTPLGVLGAVVGATSGAFAPTVYDHLRQRAAARKRVEDVAVLPGGSDGPASLLTAERGVVGFVGRVDELAALERWCIDAGAARVRLLTGPGGVGKTRLVLKLAERLEARGWGYLLVGDGREATALEDLREASEGSVLVVVDYAETRAGLAELLRSVVADDGRRVRLLLVARAAGEWWDRLGSGERPVRQVHARATVEQMALTADVGAGLTDAEIVTAAAADFARVLGVDPVPSVVVAESGGRARIWICMRRRWWACWRLGRAQGRGGWRWIWGRCLRICWGMRNGSGSKARSLRGCVRGRRV
jgi:hypothetical protein